MTTDEIYEERNDGLPENVWLREIAYQLAVLNQELAEQHFYERQVKR